MFNVLDINIKTLRKEHPDWTWTAYLRFGKGYYGGTKGKDEVWVVKYCTVYVPEDIPGEWRVLGKDFNVWYYEWERK